MKKILMRGLFILAVALVSTSAIAQSLQVTFTTTAISGAKYSPYHILAVWVKDSNGKYVRTLMVSAQKRKHELYTWNSNSGGNTTDAITGSTISAHTTHTLTWDLKDYDKSLVANGTYKLCMEMASDNKQGPYREIEFTTGGNSYSSNPSDLNNFVNITLNYTSATTAINTVDLTNSYVKIYPNPSVGNLNVDLILLQDSKTSISIFGMQNQLLATKNVDLKEGENHIDLSTDAVLLPKGIYLLLVKTNHYTIGQKLVIE